MATNPLLPDNRMRFPAGPIDFTTDVGDTGQDHDSYPTAGTQPRYDWMRLSIISLLSQQSSYYEPTQYREGSAWFDLNEMALKIRRNGEWVPYAEGVLIEEDEGVTLADFYREFQSLNLSPEVQFNDTATSNTSIITIPPDTVAVIAGKTNLVADVYIGGVLVNPDYVDIGPSQITLSGGVSLSTGDVYVVVIKNVTRSQQSTDPFVIASPNGTRYRITVDNAGTLSTTAI